MRAAGYEFHPFHRWVVGPELSTLRIRDRVRLGGHHGPDDTVRQRYRRGLGNFFTLHRPIATGWRIYDASSPASPEFVAAETATTEAVVRPERWTSICQEAGRDPS